MSKDTLYGKLVLYVPKHLPRKKKNASVTVVYYMPNGKPPHFTALNSCLAFESDNVAYEVYNPLRIEFNLDEVIVMLKNHHRVCYTEIVGNFNVLDLNNNAFE